MNPVSRTTPEAGMILPVALLCLLLLTVLTLAFLSLASSEPAIAANHVSATQAFYCADSGIERAIYHLQNAQPVDETATPFDGCALVVTGSVVAQDADGYPLEVAVVSAADGPRNAKRKVAATLYRADVVSPWKTREWREVSQ